MNDATSFEVDWKFSVEDILWNTEQMAGPLPMKCKEELLKAQAKATKYNLGLWK